MIRPTLQIPMQNLSGNDLKLPRNLAKCLKFLQTAFKQASFIAQLITFIGLLSTVFAQVV